MEHNPSEHKTSTVLLNLAADALHNVSTVYSKVNLLLVLH